MSDSNRGERSKTELAAFAAVAAVFIAGMLAWAIPEHLSYGDQATHNSESHERWADNQIGRECVSVPALASQACVDETRATSEERQREERDLEAQRKMALWTAIMGAMAVIGVGLSGFGVYLIWRTWDATREAADNSRKTLRSFIAKERAHLRIKKAAFSYEADQATIGQNFNGFRLKLANRGESACQVVEIGWQYANFRQWLPKQERLTCKPVLVPSDSEEDSPTLEFLSFRATPAG